MRSFTSLGTRVLAVAVAIAACAATLALVATAGASHSTPAADAGVAPTRITVTATEFKFVLSRSTVPTGTTVIFTVVNRGHISHNFEIAGNTTSAIAPGHSGTLMVRFAKAGKLAFLCTLPGHASAGMKGTFAVVAPLGITVTASEFAFRLSRQKVAAGTTVTFTVVNRGKIAHDFRIAGLKTPTLAAGKSAKLTVTFLKKGLYAFLCTLPGHAGAGMKGSFAVGVALPVPPATTTRPVTTTAPATTPATATGPEQLRGDPVAGAAVFSSNGCGGCHTMAAAGSTGTAGPNLDSVKPSQALVKATVQSGATAGGSQMPAFNMSDTDLNNIAAYVYKSTH